MKYLIAIPCMDMIPVQFACSILSLKQLANPAEIRFGANSLVYDTRNQLAEYAVNNGFDRILWLDSDMSFRPDILSRLAKHLDDGCEYVSGLYMTRKNDIKPCIFSQVIIEPPSAKTYTDYPHDSLFTIAASGFGGVMMTTDLIKRVSEKFGRPFSPVLGFGEDISFCIRAAAIGAELYCDSGVKMGHIGYCEYTEQTYLERIQNEQT